MLNRSQLSRNPFHVTWTQAVMARLLLGRSRRLQRQRTQRRRHESFEPLEIRTLLSASPVLSGIDPADHDDEIHSHPIFAPGTSQAYVDSFNDNIGAAGGTGVGGFNSSRWTTTATNGSGLTQGTPTTLTWSIVPDGTAIPALGGINTESADSSNLVAYLGGIYGVSTNDSNYTDEPWFAHFQSVFSRWSQLTGINYVYSAADDGAAFTNTTANPGVLGVRGDVRIGGHHIDGNSNVLAYNFFPNHGDMVIDTGDNFYTTTTSNSIRLRNVLAHEAGHGIGLNHVDSNNASFLMEPFINTGFDGPQLDDILAAQRMYGDNLENNESFATASSFGSVAIGQTVTYGIHGTTTAVSASDSQFVTVDGTSDVDFYSFSVGGPGAVTVTLTPQGTTYNQGPQGGTQTSLNTATLSPLDVQLVGTTGVTVLATGATSPAGPFKTLTYNVPTSGTYYVRVTGTVDTVQAYRVSIGLSNSTPSGVYVVDTLVDESDGNFGVGDLSLREAVQLANATLGAEEINFASGLNGTINLTIDQLLINDDVQINGPGAGQITVSGGNAFRVFDLQSNPDVTITGLTISGGRTAGSVQGGAGIRSTGTLNLVNSLLQNNTTVGAGANGGGLLQVGGSLLIQNTSILNNSTTGSGSHGGGIYSVGGSVTIVNSTIDGNSISTASGAGGGIVVAGAGLSVTDSTVSNNSNLGAGGLVGGIAVSGGNLLVTGSTISGNSTSGAGGGIGFDSNGTAVSATIVNSTISGNTAGTFGGGVATFNGALQLRHSTVTNNTAVVGQGSGLASYSDGSVSIGNTTVFSSIVAGNLNSDADNVGTGGNTISSDGFNLIGTGNAAPSFGQSTDTVNVANPLLGALSNNGGPTRTHALLLGSLALDGGDVATTLTNDQRGSGYTRLISGRVDIGSFEQQAPTPTVDLTVDNASILEGGGTAFFTATLSNVAAFDVTVTLSFSGSTTFPGDYTRSGTQIVIPAGSLSGTVSVTAVQDTYAETAETIVASIQSLTNASVGSSASATASIANDDGAPAFTLVVSSPTIAENGGTTTATIQRNTDPSTALVVNVSSSDTTEASVPSTVTFAAGQSSVTFTVSGIDDNIIDGTQSASISVSLAGFTSATATVNVTDNDVAGFVFSQTTGILTGEENEFLTAPNALMAAVTVRLTSQPTSNVTIALSSSDLTEGTIQPSSIVFTTSNWNQPQQISIFGVDDFVDDGDIAYSIITGAAVSSDPNYSGLNPVDLSVTNIDNDAAGLVITESAGSTNVSEGGVSDSYTVRLASQPMSNVTVSLGGGGQLATSPGSMIFTPANWNVNQTVTVSAVNDLVSEGLHAGTLTHTVTSADLLFNSLSPLNINVAITDNDAAALSVSIAPNTISENGGTAIGTVTRNTADLSRAVVVTLISSDTSELTVPTFVTIPAGASSTTFTVTAVDDTLLDGTQTATVTAFSNTTGGSLDPSFGIGGLAAIPAYQQNLQPSFPEIVEQPDGKYVVAGRHLTLTNAWNVIRLNRDGSLDSTFGVGGVATTTFPADIQPQGIALYPDGQILVLGRSLSDNGHGVARYTSSGVLNLQINPTGTNIFGQDIVVDNIGDGGFLVGGSNTAGTDFAVTRYRYDGTVDTTYGTAGTGTLARPATNETGWAMAQQTDGKVIVVGTSNGDFGATRFNRNGTTDAVFNFTGLSSVNFGSFDSAQAVAIAPDGKIVLAGITNGNWGVTRLTINGALDTGFGTFGLVNQDFSGLSEDAHTVGVQPDGKIVVGGGAFFSGQGTNLALARYNVNGSLDTTFDLDGKLVLAAQPSIFEETRALAIQADGNIIALGGYQSSFFAFRVLAGQPSLQFGSTTVQVTDYETLSLSISPSTISENGGVATGTIVRNNTDLSGPLTVNLTNVDSSEISLPATVTIPAGQSSVTFTMTGVDEALIDGTQVVSVDATASGYVGTTSSINVTDDETTRLIVTVNPGEINEAAGTAAASLTITRNSSTTSALTVTLSSSDGTEAVVQSTVVIPAGQNSVTVPIDAVDDFVIDGSVTVTISASAAGHDTGTSSLVVADNDSAGITVNPVAGLETTEAGGTAIFSVVLTSQPTADVTIPLASSDSSEGTISVSSLTFTPGNWNIAQVVTITGVDDLQDDGDVLFSVLTGSVISGDANYSGLDPSDASVTNLDDDLAQLSLTISSALISEGAGVNAATATISRNSDTSQPLTVTLQVNDGSEVSVPVSVVIPAGASSASFDIAAIDDLIVDGTQTVTISATAAGHVGTSATLNVTDDDVAGFSIIGGGVLTVDESGSTQTFGVVLNAAPLTNVVITITSDDLTEATVAPATLTFTPANWNVAQLVTLSGIDDLVDDEAQFSTITVSVDASASDDAFDSIASNTVLALTFDDDTAGIKFTPNTGLLIVEGSVTDSVAITLTTQPTANVTFALSNATPDQVTFSTYSVTFTPSNWNVPQVVVITGIDNQIAEGGFGVGISPEPAVSDDPKYNGLQTGGANGSIIDDDFRQVIVDSVHENISENGTSTTFWIVLNSEPTGNVSIPISSGDPTEGSVSVSILNFTPSNWNVPQFVTVTGVDDSIVDDHVRFDVITGVISGTSDYAGIDPEDVSVLNLDNDVLTLSLTITPTGIAENGGIATGTISRNDGNLSLPLTVSLFSSDTTEASVPTTVTIPAGQTSVTFTVSGVDDTLNDGAQPVVISATAGGYSGANDSLSVADNDGPVISENTLTISEGGSVVLTSAQISTSDPEFSPSQLVYTASNISGGRFEVTSAPGVAITSFTQAQINAGVVRFVHNGGEAAPAYLLSVTAGAQTSAAIPAVVTFTNVNDAPTVSGTLNNISVLQGAASQTISLLTVFSDVDDVTLSYAATSSNATLAGVVVSGSNLTISFSATLTGSAVVTVTATDAGGLSASTSFTVTVTAVNSGPGVTLVNGVLRIVGTNGHDNLQINKVGNQYQIVGCFLTPNVNRYSVSQVQSIEIEMLGGNDHVNVNDSVLIPVTIRGGDGCDSLDGGGGNDLIYGGAGNDELEGDEGHDVLFGEAGDDELEGNDGNDTLYGGDGNDELEGDDGNDLLFGEAGHDELEGNDGNDTLYGGDGNDELEGDDGNDLLFGEAGHDELEGNDGNDILSGGSGNDELEGDAGRDLLFGGLGSDLLKGDSDGDLLVGSRVTFENDVVALQLVLAEWTSNRSYTSRVANLRGTGSGTRLNGTTFLNASTVLNDNAIDTLMGSSGQDWFLGTVVQDLFSGRASNEQIN